MTDDKSSNGIIDFYTKTTMNSFKKENLGYRAVDAVMNDLDDTLLLPSLGSENYEVIDELLDSMSLKEENRKFIDQYPLRKPIYKKVIFFLPGIAIIVVAFSNVIGSVSVSQNSVNKTIQEPSHVRMCKGILDRTKPDAPKEYFVSTTVEESPEVCHNWESDYGYLLEIFASSMLTRFSTIRELKVDYDPNCRRFITGEENERRKFLPEQLRFDFLRDNLDQYAVTELCTRCIHDYEQLGTYSPQCISSPQTLTTSSVNRVWIFRNLFLPWLKTNRLYIGDGENDKDIESYNMRLSIWKSFSGALEIATVFISCSPEECVDETCTCKNYAVPFFRVVEKIPQNVVDLNVVQSPSCESDQKCTVYTEDLTSFLKALYPRTNVECTTSEWRLHLKTLLTKYRLKTRIGRP